MSDYFHSVTLDKDKCKGCINCIKRCPTEAIRVRNGKAKIINQRCIDCGECIKVCPYSAKTAKTDSLEIMNNYKYKIALPAPTLYGQFRNIEDVNVILTGLIEIGFDDVFEVTRAADIVSDATKKFLENKDYKKPVICSACPACVRLIKIRFPNLIENVLPILSPMDIAAKIARKEAMEKTGLKSNEIGIFFISPCAAKVTWAKSPIGTDKTNIDGVFSISEIYLKLAHDLPMLSEIKKLSKSSGNGVGWANIGGETNSLKNLQSISVDGIDNVINILEEVENEQIENLDFLEINACVGGCVGGPLNIENSFVAKAKINKIRKKILQENADIGITSYDDKDIYWETPLEYEPILKLDENILVAMKKMDTLEAINKGLPGLDCGSCGAPSCKSLAEDIVRGFASEGDCIFKLREKVKALAKEMVELQEHMPPPFRMEKSD